MTMTDVSNPQHMRQIDSGCPEPLGVTLAPGGANVAVFSAHATAIELCLFDASGGTELARMALPERTGDVFHGFVADLNAGHRYGLRAHGPYDPRNGHRFNPAKLLVDPYARSLDRPFMLHPPLFGELPDGARNDSDSATFVPKAIVLPDFAQVAARHPRTPPSRAVVYELHVRGFTKLHPEIPEVLRGTCAALAHPAALAHLVRLGITTVELMPVVAAVADWHLAPLGLSNYWGYNPVALMVADLRLAPGGMAELAGCVAAFHDAGIEVLLDIVLNHTGEGDARGPTLSLRGLDNATYYRTDTARAEGYVDDTGCGNTLALDRPPVLRLALDALRFYAVAAGVDGFRFDLATTMGRTERGFDPAAPLLAAIAQDPVLRTLKLVAEPWDVGKGGYRLGEFGANWNEWNDRYRDTVRRFWRGDAGMTGELATRIAGSADVFAARRRPPSCSVNFVAAHDGFTLRDLVAFERKHNEANGEGNHDGSEVNFSWNHGIEGASPDPAIEARRRRDVRSLLATLFVSRGTPMLAMGDESGRSQNGNNNAYTQDNATTWLDWAAMDADLVAFVATLTALREAHPALRDDCWLRGEPVDASGVPDVQWRHADGSAMTADDWEHPEGRVIVAVLYTPASDGTAADHVAIALNAAESAVTVRWPDARDGFRWRRAIDTAEPTGVPVSRGAGNDDLIAARSAVVLVGEAHAGSRGRDSGIEPEVLDRLARAAGIAPRWRDVQGRAHIVGDDTRRAVLAAMGLGAATTGQARARLAELSARRERRVLPRTQVVGENIEARLAMAVGDRQWPRRGALEVRGENGEARRVPFCVDDLPGGSIVAADGGTVLRRFLTLPSLPIGSYTITIEDKPESACRLVVAPRGCYLPAVLREGGRRFGLAAHLYALRRAGDQGIGDFTTLQEAGAATAAAGGVVVALNPLHALFAADRERSSPYQPSDRRFLDPIYIDVERVPDLDASPQARRALDQRAHAILRLARQAVVDYVDVWQVKQTVLALCFQAFERRGRDDGLAKEFERFVHAGGKALMRFATFEAIAAGHPSPWTNWPAALRHPEGRAAADFAQSHARDVRFALYLQWLADRQLGQAATASRDIGLAFGFCRDLAVGAAPDGGEAWATQESLAHGASIGAPPDPFAAGGQVWNVPPPLPEALAGDGYDGFRALIRANVRHAGLLRIDHVMSLERLFWVPAGARGADGAYVSYPLEELLGVLALESLRARCAIIGEDLGTVPEGFRERMAGADVLSYQPLWFQRDGATFRAPSRYAAKAVASVSTHDLPTFAGWWGGADIAERRVLRLLDDDAARAAQEDRHQEKEALATAVRAERLPAFATFDPAVVDHVAATQDIHRFIGDTPAMLVLIQADDLAAETIAQNLPGTDRERPNWQRKVGVMAAELWRTECGAVAARDYAATRGRTGDDDAS
jgi:glycogen debranching enzyme GlgX/4-alpha-glucanotransferase